MEYLESCPSCGAARARGAERCELCGTSLRVSEREGDRLTCSTCGHGNPEASRFCNRCGAALPEASAGREPSSGGTSSSSGEVVRERASIGSTANESTTDDNAGMRPSSEVGRRALLIVGTAVAIVVGLYLLSSWLANRPEQTGGEETERTVVSSDQVPLLPDTLQQAADAFEAENTAEGWFEAGRYYLTEAWETQQSDPESSVLWARRAIEYFERSLAMEDNPDVRLAAAEAASLERSDPMRPIEELQTILAEYPEHVGANLMLGERRVMIGRFEDAIASFEKVLDVAPDGDPRRAAAGQFLEVARQRMAEN